ncbi:MAG: hypothetical protein LC732_01955, partial [Acidobacteria bacterium]|nr:hypothetical protein [Acidobacteriota bacterium]
MFPSTSSNGSRPGRRGFQAGLVVTSAFVALFAFSAGRADVRGRVSRQLIDQRVNDNARQMVEEGRRTFRHDTFGSEDFWGGALRLHEAIAGAANGGIGPGLSPAAALGVGLKVDSTALPAPLVQQLRRG